MPDGSGPLAFDWQHPDYAPIFAQRMDRLARIRAEVRREREAGEEPRIIPGLRAYYREHIAQFISDWGVTVDPRNIERGLPAFVPFILFPKQIEFIEYVLRKWREGRRGLAEKSRDCGVSWLCVSTAATLCLHFDGMAIGFGSRKEEYVDKADDPKSLFWKAREFISHLPREFRGGWERKKHSAHMRLAFPLTGATMTGEAGDNIGRGDRAAIYFVDEAAFLERPQLAERSLQATTNCRIDVSSVNGLANVFADNRHSGRIEVFIFDWRDDPRKDDAWYQKQLEDYDPVTIASEVDRNYSASVEGVIIPNAWVQAAVDAHIKLGIHPTGARRGSLDVADEGPDSNAFIVTHGIVIEHIEDWTGKGSDTFATTERAFDLCDELQLEGFEYDADGLGAGVRGDARVINERRAQQGSRQIEIAAFRGSGEVINPRGQDIQGRFNEDFFMNHKAQGWWTLRTRFLKTFRAVEDLKLPEGKRRPYNPDELISIAKAAGPKYLKLVSELSQPTIQRSVTGKMVVDKKPEGARSPNLADCTMMRFAPKKRGPIVITDEALGKV